MVHQSPTGICGGEIRTPFNHWSKFVPGSSSFWGWDCGHDDDSRRIDGKKNMRQTLAIMVAGGIREVHMRQSSLVEPAPPCSILFQLLESTEGVLSISEKR